MRHTVEPTLTGRLGPTYPASKHDVELRVFWTEGDGGPAELADAAGLANLLARESARVLTQQSGVRKVVFAAPAGDLVVIAAAEQAGFRYVVDVDLPGEELSLLVREPSWVTQVDMDLDRVPTGGRTQ